jgi:hypothetical protein
MPLHAEQLAIRALQGFSSSKRRCHGRRHGKDPLGTLGLGRDEGQPAVRLPLERPLDPDQPLVKVGVVPPQAQCLALPQS